MIQIIFYISRSKVNLFNFGFERQLGLVPSYSFTLYHERSFERLIYILMLSEMISKYNKDTKKNSYNP